MSILIKGFPLPNNCGACPLRLAWCRERIYMVTRPERCPLIPVPPHGDLIDRDALRQSMYHEAFETDSPMQKWDSGCWIRYKMFERMEEAAPTIIPAEEVYGQFTDTAGNLHWTGTHSGEHIIPAEEGEI